MEVIKSKEVFKKKKMKKKKKKNSQTANTGQ
jgi:hypothetical protein